MKNIVVVGASGAVGEEILRVLDELNFPVGQLRLLASAKSAGKSLQFRGEEYVIEELDEHSFDEEDTDIAFFAAGGSISEKYAPIAAAKGALVIDNSSFFRMQEGVPLIVPECNAADFAKHAGIIANPNCSTIQMVHALAPIAELFGIERVDVCTYQAASGAGVAGMEDLVESMKAFFGFELSEYEPRKFCYPLALNLIPQIDDFAAGGYTKEELKMMNETGKIMHQDFAISATCVRVPVLRSHSEAISVRCKQPVDLAALRAAYGKLAHIVVVENHEQPAANSSEFVRAGEAAGDGAGDGAGEGAGDGAGGTPLRYAMPLYTSDTNETYISRLRIDRADARTLHLWCVADQIRVGAATNAVRIAQLAL